MPHILIVGLGSIGRRHLRNLLHLGFTEILLCDKFRRPIEEAPGMPVLRDLSDALSEEPEAVFVTCPTAQHMEVALPAAKAGCNLFIEKPLSNSWEGVGDLLAAVRDRKLLGMVGFDLRFDPGLCVAKRLIEENCIGRVVAIHAQVGQYLPDWRPHEDYRKGMSATVEMGGGVILDLIHELDYVSWLAGPVVQVACFADKVSRLEIETEDTAAIVLKFADGAIGSVNLDYVQRSESRTCRIVGEEGTILWDYFGNKVRWYEAASTAWREEAYPDFQRNDRFVAEMRHVLSCLQGDERPKVDLVTGAEVLKLALAAKESAKTGTVCRMT